MLLMQDKEFCKRLEELRLQANRILNGKLAGTKITNKRGQSYEFIDYRNYTYGDDFRKIDWNIYSRLGELMIRMYHANEEMMIHFILDLSNSMKFGEQVSKIVQGYKCLLGLAYIALSNNEKVKVYGINDSNIIQSPVYSKKNDILSIDKFIEEINVKGSANFENIYNKFLNNVTKKGLVIYISDFLENNNWDKIINNFFYKGHDFIGIQILSGEELNPKISGDVMFIDSENNRSVDLTIDNLYIDNYKTHLNKYLKYIKEVLFRKNFGYMLCSAESDFVEIILRNLKKWVF